MNKIDVKRHINKVEKALPSIKAVNTENGWKLVVNAFGIDEWFNIQYINKVFSDSPYKVVKQGETSNDSADSDEGDVW